MDALQRPQASQHQAGADQQHHRERHLDDHERVAEALTPAAARRALRAVLERLGQIDPQRAQRRREAESDAGDDARRWP